MPIPDYQSLMLPVLKLAADGEIHVRDAADRLAIELAVTPEERAMMLPSGGRTLLANRMHWAKSYMLKAGLVRSPRRGYFTIIDRGREVLASRPPRIDNDLLMRFEQFREFIEKSRSPESQDRSPDAPRGDRPAVAVQATPVAAAEETPDEANRSAVRTIDETLAKDLIDRILAASPTFFENAVVALLLAMGYGGSREDAGRAIGRSGDGGLDGVIDEDALGLDRVYVQAKRYAPDNPRKSIQRRFVPLRRTTLAISPTRDRLSLLESRRDDERSGCGALSVIAISDPDNEVDRADGVLFGRILAHDQLASSRRNRRSSIRRTWPCPPKDTARIRTLHAALSTSSR